MPREWMDPQSLWKLELANKVGESALSATTDFIEKIRAEYTMVYHMRKWQKTSLLSKIEISS